MIDLSKNVLPEAVEVCGRFYKVHTSFKYWLAFKKIMDSKPKSYLEFDFLYDGEKPNDRSEGFKALLGFANPEEKLPRMDGKDGGKKVLDFDIDSDYIYSAFLELYGIDLIESSMHYLKFQALLKGLHGTKLNDIIGYRLYENHSRTYGEYERQMEELQRAWELPDEDDEDDEKLSAFDEWVEGKGK
ncbi:MAG: hypothetical protein IJ717_00905 [Treponema sp.]|nr:hypothetical protein [Treponema sp.]